ncbi:MAG: tetratricopeptide repeat protein [Geminicoccaceae bacterium]
MTLMRKGIPRSSQGSAGRNDFDEQPSDVFEQPERSLLGEALGRPVGFGATLVILVAAGVFIANHFFFYVKRIDDFALLGFFVGGGVLLSTLLRAGDPNVASQKRTRAARSQAPDNELVLADPFEEEAAVASGGMAVGAMRADRREADVVVADGRTSADVVVADVRSRGLAEAPAMSAPVPSAALVPPKAVKPAPDPVDDEVDNFQQALVHYVNEGDFHGQGEVLRRLGHLAKGRGHLKESRDFYMNSRSCFRKINDHYAEAAVLLDLGQVLESLEEHDAASAAYRDANRALLDVAMNSGDRYNAIQAHAAD